MVQEHTVEGFDALQEKLKEIKGTGSGNIYIIYTGSLDPDGKSWCPDCVVADPVIENSLQHLPDSAVLIHCRVGQRDYWKDANNPFRIKMGINCVPTLVKHGSSQKKLEEAQCADAALLEMMFEDDD